MNPQLQKALTRYTDAIAEVAAAKAELEALTSALCPPPASAELQTIQEIVAEYFRLSPHIMWSRERHEPLATARNIAMTLAARLTSGRSEEIALAFRRSRYCVAWAERSVSARHDTEAVFRAMFADIEARVRSQLGQVAA